MSALLCDILSIGSISNPSRYSDEGSKNSEKLWYLYHCCSLVSLYLRLHKRCPYSELFWSVFSCIWTEFGEILRNSTFSYLSVFNPNEEKY